MLLPTVANQFGRILTAGCLPVIIVDDDEDNNTVVSSWLAARIDAF